MGPLSIRKTSGNSSHTVNAVPESSVLVEERAFFSALNESISDGIKDSMGPQILGMLRDRGFLDHPSDPAQFHKQLTTIFGNGAAVLEKIIVKELFHKLNLAYDSSGQFDYGNALARARQVCILEVR